jgi:hypothetical protein
MDCRTAQQLLTFDRPHAPELTPEDRAALGRHLAVCPKCRAVEQAERALDDTLGKAMRAVEVPDGLERNLHATLDREHEDERRHWWRRAGRNALAVAASLLLVIGGAYAWQWWAKPVPDVFRLHDITVLAFVNPPSDDRLREIEDDFRSKGVATQLPRNVNYAYFNDCRLADFEGRQVPMLTFLRVEGARMEYAQVFVLSARQFNLKDIQNDPVGPGGYPRRVTIRHESIDYYDVFVHTGENIDWLLLHNDKPL